MNEEYIRLTDNLNNKFIDEIIEGSEDGPSNR